MRKNEARLDVGKTFYLNASLCDLSLFDKTKGLSKDIGFLQYGASFLKLFTVWKLIAFN